MSVFTATPFSGVDHGEYQVVIENNKIYDNEIPIRVHVQNVANISSNNDFSGNTFDEIHVETGNSSGYRITKNVTWQAHEQPYILNRGGLNLNAKLTIEPGATLKFDLDESLTLHNSSGGRDAGQLYAVGTPQKPIIFTSIEDIPKYWKGITVSSTHPNNEIAYAIIENTGNESSGNRWTQGNVVLSHDDHMLNIHNVTFKTINPKFCAVRGPAVVNNITVIGHEEGEYCIHNASHRIGDNNYDM